MRWVTKYVHYLAGFLSALMPPHILFATLVSFVLYEVFEYMKKNDTLYLEMREYSIGLYVGGVVRCLLLLLLHMHC